MLIISRGKCMLGLGVIISPLVSLISIELHSLGSDSWPSSPRIKVRVSASYLIIAMFIENNNQSFTDESAAAAVDA